MIISNADRLRDDYLARLDAAMRDLPHGVAAEIRGGILEELQGLDAAATAARIDHLGDPEQIAREAGESVQFPQSPLAHSEHPLPTAATPAATPQHLRPPATSTRGFAITAALVLSFGGIVLPAIGWVVGIVLVCFSPLWRTWEKFVAIIVPFVITALVVLSGIGAFATMGGVVVTESSGSGTAEVVNNPLMPAAYDLVWTGVLAVGLLAIPASGLWLLWRMRRR